MFYVKRPNLHVHSLCSSYAEQTVHNNFPTSHCSTLVAQLCHQFACATAPAYNFASANLVQIKAGVRCSAL